MKLGFKVSFKMLVICLVLQYPPETNAQEPQKIKVKKESNLVKAVFDNSEMRLMVVDRFGNPRENKILSYLLTVKGKRETKTFRGFSNALSGDMLNYLDKQTSVAKLFFTEIQAQEDEHMTPLPDLIEAWFPDCNNCEKGTKKK